MEDFIDNGWIDAIDIGFNESIAKNASKIVKECEKNLKYFGNQWYADFAGYKAILLKPGEGYEWHFDNMDYVDGVLSCPRPSRFWSQLTYLTDGQPFEIGDWNPLGERVEQTEFSAPIPNKILARVYPKPGVTVVFPCFMVHRIKPVVNTRRWAIVSFIDNPNYKKMNKKTLQLIFKRYFNEHSRF